MKLTASFIPAFLMFTIFACSQSPSSNAVNTNNKYEIVKSEADWKKILSPQQFHVLREKGTEQAFTGTYWDNHEKGTYQCAACKLDLFSSVTKFESGTGWPSFFQPVADKNVKVLVDKSYGMIREEVVCSRCGGHLGHVFSDGPNPTGLRYCMNSASLSFVKQK